MGLVLLNLLVGLWLVGGCGDDDDSSDVNGGDYTDTDSDTDTDVDTDGESCDSPETSRCNGDVVETCRMVNAGLFWFPIQDCSLIPGGVCEDTEDDTEPFCTGNFWDSGYCPGSSKPAAPECRDITAVGCCNVELQQSLFCDEATDTLYCTSCWADSYYSEYCTWDENHKIYGCSYLENGEAETIEDPSGENPISCPE